MCQDSQIKQHAYLVGVCLGELVILSVVFDSSSEGGGVSLSLISSEPFSDSLNCCCKLATMAADLSDSRRELVRGGRSGE